MNNEFSNSPSKIEDNFVSTKHIASLGLLVFLTILAPALLHTNLEEFLIKRFNVEVLDASYFDAALYLSYLIVGILTAVLSNKFGRRKFFILVGSLGSSIFFFAMTITLSFPVLLVFRFLQGGFTVLCWQTLMTLVLDLSTPTNRGKNMGIFGIFLALAMGGGPVLGGIFSGIGDLFPYYAASIISIVVFIASVIFLVEPSKLTIKSSIKENLAIPIKEPRLIIPGIFNFIDRFHIGFILFTLQFFLQSELNVSPELRGMVLGLFATPYILLQYPVGKLSDRIGRYKPLIIGSIATWIIFSLIGFSASYGLFAVIIVFMLLGFANGFTGPPSMALVGDIVKKEDNATGVGFFNLLGNIGIILGPLVGGFLLTNTDIISVFIIAGLFEIISLLAIIILLVTVFKEKPDVGEL
jgi:DHA1 family tetracycline resistance protein-like MFS transporter